MPNRLDLSSDPSSRRTTILLAALAVALRVAAILVLQSHTVPRSTYEHGEIAENLLAGRGFSIHFLGADGPTSQQAPVYPFLVAGAYALCGIETPGSLLILQLGQALLGGLLVVATMRLTRELCPGSRAAAILAGLIVAAHPTLVYAATHIQVALLAAVLVAASLASAARAGRTGSLRLSAASGSLLALLVLTDPILGLAGLSAAWLCARSAEGVVRFDAPTARRVALLSLVAALGVTPWIARNALVHGEFVFIKSTFGYAFWQGNNALSHGTDKVVRPSVERVLADDNATTLAAQNRRLWAARHEAGYIDDIALSRADIAQLSTLSEPERSRVLFRRALDDLRAEPGRYPRLCLDRMFAFLAFDTTNPKTRHPVYRAGHLGLSLLAVVGWLAAGSAARRRLLPLVMLFALVAAFHSLTIVSARFHIPVEPLMAVVAGAGLPVLATSLTQIARRLFNRLAQRADSSAQPQPMPGS